MNAADMINRCFRHQNPDAYGGESIEEPHIPAGLRYGGGDIPSTPETLPQQEMGNGEVLP